MIFSVFQKNRVLGVFLVHHTVVSVLLSALVEKCFVSCMQDVLTIFLDKKCMSVYVFKIPELKQKMTKKVPSIVLALFQ